MGTIWLQRVLAGVAAEFGLKLTKSKNRKELPDDDTDIIFANHSHFMPDSMNEFVASHLIRDLRDVVVSGYHYHLWTNEAWALQPCERFDGKSYQELLRSVDRNAGLTYEIQRLALSFDIRILRNWNFADERVCEISYEKLWQDEQKEFHRLFEHYGFHDSAISKCLQIAKRVSFKTKSKSKQMSTHLKQHMRSGMPGQWKLELNANHCELIKSELGDLIIELGQAEDNNWHWELI